jgi:hypothetical protein
MQIIHSKNILILNPAKNLLIIALLLFFSSLFSFAQETDSLSYYSAIHYKGSAKIDIKDQRHNCQFNFVNVIDSFLYFQANVAGIEVGRVLVTPDNILFINKFERNYFEGDFFDLLMITGMDLDFYTLQDIFNGVPTYPPFGFSVSYSGELEVDDFSFFKVMNCEYDNLAMKLEIKKVTFDDVPAVSATIPKNCTRIGGVRGEE